MSDHVGDHLALLIESSGLKGTGTAVAGRSATGERITRELGPAGHADPVTVSSVMYAASLAKQVVGILLAAQVVAGSIEAEQPIGETLDLPSWSRDIRVRHLVHHTSGLPQIDSGTSMTNEGVLDALRVATAPEAPAGSRHAYCNAGYVCLAEILVRSTKRTLDVLAKESLFERFGMTSTSFSSEPVAHRPGQAQPPGTLGDGGLWTTASDLLRWNDAMNARALETRVHELSETPGHLDDGTPLDYAWGIRVLDAHGDRVLSHGGSWPTWTSKAVRQPGRGTSVAMMSVVEDAAAVTTASLGLLEALGRT